MARRLTLGELIICCYSVGNLDISVIKTAKYKSSGAWKTESENANLEILKKTHADFTLYSR